MAANGATHSDLMRKFSWKQVATADEYVDASPHTKKRDVSLLTGDPSKEPELKKAKLEAEKPPVVAAAPQTYPLPGPYLTPYYPYPSFAGFCPPAPFPPVAYPYPPSYFPYPSPYAPQFAQPVLPQQPPAEGVPTPFSQPLAPLPSPSVPVQPPSLQQTVVSAEVVATPSQTLEMDIADALRVDQPAQPRNPTGTTKPATASRTPLRTLAPRSTTVKSTASRTPLRVPAPRTPLRAPPPVTPTPTPTTPSRTPAAPTHLRDLLARPAPNANIQPAPFVPRALRNAPNRIQAPQAPQAPRNDVAAPWNSQEYMPPESLDSD